MISAQQLAGGLLEDDDSQESAADALSRMAPAIARTQLEQAIEGATAEFLARVDSCNGSADRADELAGDIAYQFAIDNDYAPNTSNEWEAILSVLFKLAGELCPEDGPDEENQAVDESRGPAMQTLKDNRTDLDDAERKEVMRKGAVWPHGPAGKPTPGVWKSVIRGRTWYVSNTHRCYRAARSLKKAIRDFAYVKTTA